MRCLVGFLTCVSLWPATLASAEPVDYVKHVKPILARRCYACHASLKQKAGLRLDTGIAIRRGGDSGPAVDPADVDGSLLIERVTATVLAERMPPEGEPLAAEQIQILKEWVRGGAASPENEQPERDPREHWAFRTPVRPPVLTVKHADRVRNPIDNLVLIELERLDLTPNPPADKSTLLRRVYFDLIGLPPTRDELLAFLADESPDAYEKVVEKLLASPQHGERWARHLMDVWRYSDWYGRRAVPDVWNSAPQVWRWRDWIIRSLNSDKGYDALLREMLAADEVAPEDDDAQVATGYLVRNWYALNPNQWMREIVEHTGKAFLGLTLNCAHCHDHKYDPISQEEYFRFRAFFEPIDLRQDRVRGEPDPGPFQKYEYSVLRKVQQLGRVSVFDAKPDAKTQMYLGGDERNFEKMPAVAAGAPAFLGGDLLHIEPVSLPPAAHYPGVKPWLQAEELAAREQAVAAARMAIGPATEAVSAAKQAVAEIEEQERQAGESKSPADPDGFKLPGATGGLSARGDAGDDRTGSKLPVAPAGGAESKSPADPKLADKKLAAVRKLIAAQADLRVKQTQLATAEAQLDFTRARIAADQARFKLPGATGGLSARADQSDDRTGSKLPVAPDGGSESKSAETASPLAQAASKAERFAALRAAEEKLALAEQAKLVAESTGPDKIKSAEQQVAAAKAAVEAATKAHAADGTTYSPLTSTYPPQSTGRRKALADWIIRADHPLTSRVAVNHVWARHFGRPLVATVSDFGRNGAAPSHPELIDWLAVELREHGWSLKHLHRLIVLSNTYRQSSRVESPESRFEIAAPSSGLSTLDARLASDPDNRWLWRFPERRLEAEPLRDAIVFAAGELDATMFGQPLANDPESMSRRRAIYFSVYPEDGGAQKFLEMFDPPDPCDCYRRTESIVPQQALVLTNSRFLLHHSRVLAGKLTRQCPLPAGADDVSPSQSRFVQAAFETVLTRAPNGRETTACLEFLQRQAEGIGRRTEPAPTAGGNPPIAAPSADPAQRARESLVRALFNHNDFAAVR